MNPIDQIDDDIHPMIADIAAIVGKDAALRLVADFGGRTLYVPRDPGPHHPLAVSIGHGAAQVLAAHHVGELLRLPIGSATSSGRRRRIIELSLKGWSRFAISRAVGLTERRVYQVLQEARGASDQPDLFA